MLDVLDVIAGLALALVIVSLALVWAIRTAWRLMCNLRDEETEHAHTRRRLADVEAIRRRDAVADAHDDGGACSDCGTTGWGSDHDEDCRNHPGRRFDPEEVSELPAAIHLHGCNTRSQAEVRARRELVEAAKRPAHGGYPDAIKARDLARSRPHLKAVDSDRATDRAYAEAGIMPVADYVAKHGEEPRR